VVSVLAPTLRGAAHAPLERWLEQRTDRLFLSVVTVAELTSGLVKLRRAGSTRKAALLDEWLDSVLELYGDRVLPFDRDAARVTGALADDATARGLAPGFADLAIAGIAQANGLVLLTRNLRHLAPLGVAALDPYAGLPD
jgi:predicted nucleic acid-binding protein